MVIHSSVADHRAHIPTSQELGRRMRDFLRPKELGGKVSPDVLYGDYELWPPQVDVMDAAVHAMMEGKGSGLFIRPPRTGKTIFQPHGIHGTAFIAIVVDIFHFVTYLILKRSRN